MREIESTDQLPKDNLDQILMGLFGEVGSIMAAAKKHVREDKAYARYQQALEEEFGDVLWYFTTLCQRLGTGIDSIFSDVSMQEKYNKCVAASGLLDGPISHISSASQSPALNEALLKLGEAMTALLSIKELNKNTQDSLFRFADHYLQALQVAKMSFSKIVRMNIEKTHGRFLKQIEADLPTFDSGFPDEEKLPDQFKIEIIQRKNRQSYMRWNGVFIGSPLTDSIPDPDGYRFHDVFHLAYASILHWSPTFRSLIKQKRKSDPEVDEAEDGGRAIVIEEGLTAWIFSSYAKHLNFFEGHDRVSFDLLKTVSQFVQGYEVEHCPLSLWEKAILRGYSVFRKVRSNNGGIVIGNRKDRTIEYRSINRSK